MPRTMNLPMPEGKTPMVACCGRDGCDHVWVVCWLPMDMADAAAVMKASRCPACASPRVMMATSAQAEPLFMDTDRAASRNNGD